MVRRLDGIAALGARQAELVAALVAGGELPAGFAADAASAHRIAAATAALTRKRAGEVAKAWPLLAAATGPQWAEEFTAWAAGRAPAGAFADGWSYARALAASGSLPARARIELAVAEVRFALVRGVPRPRRFPAVRRVDGAFVVQILGRITQLGG